MAASAPAVRSLARAAIPIPLSARPRTARVSLLPLAPPAPAQRLALGRTGQARLPARSRSVRCLAALSPEMRETLDKVVGSSKVLLFMKGTKDFPQCGFSHTVVQILRSLDVPFETLDVLANEALRQGLKEYSSWPTFPQLYIDGEFFGGCDITVGKLLYVLSLHSQMLEPVRFTELTISWYWELAHLFCLSAILIH
jgi:monothiol glutaredoxin